MKRFRSHVLPDGPPARRAATSWRVYRLGQDDLLWASRCSVDKIPDQREGPCCRFCRDKFKRRANARPPRRRPVRQDISFSEAKRADVGGVGRKRHGFEVHGAHAVVGAEKSAKEAAAQVEFHRVIFDGEVLRLAGEVAEDDEDWVGGGDVLWFADHDEDVLVVAVDGEVLAGVDGCVAVMKLDESAVPVKERGRIGVL